MPPIASLECSRCHALLSAETPQTVCPKCAGVLFVRYDLKTVSADARPAPGGRQDMWRYAAVLPAVEPVTLGEGWTPMLPSRRYTNLFLKEEATNPTGTFKTRSMSVAVSMARHYKLRKLAIASTGNAAGALAAYAAAAGIEAHLFIPKDAPMANCLESIAYGAHVTLVDGTISNCAKIAAERKDAEGWFDLSALQEPFRVEGAKTIGYELVEQLGWEYPDAVIYPAGSGMGLIGMWKAFEEMETLGWVRPSSRPKMIAVQASGCAPIARAFEAGAEASSFYDNARTIAAGLRVPKPYGDSLVLDILRRSGGTMVEVDDGQIIDSLRDWARHEGLLLSPEGAAATAAYALLIDSSFLRSSDRVVAFNPGSGLKYVDVLVDAMGLRQTDKKKYPVRSAVGGIITPV